MIFQRVIPAVGAITVKGMMEGYHYIFVVIPIGQILYLFHHLRTRLLSAAADLRIGVKALAEPPF